jgi:hypothetical protein
VGQAKGVRGLPRVPSVKLIQPNESFRLRIFSKGSWFLGDSFSRRGKDAANHFFDWHGFDTDIFQSWQVDRSPAYFCRT